VHYVPVQTTFTYLTNFSLFHQPAGVLYFIIRSAACYCRGTTRDAFVTRILQLQKFPFEKACSDLQVQSSQLESLSRFIAGDHAFMYDENSLENLIGLQQREQPSQITLPFPTEYTRFLGLTPFTTQNCMSISSAVLVEYTIDTNRHLTETLKTDEQSIDLQLSLLQLTLRCGYNVWSSSKA